MGKYASIYMRPFASGSLVQTEGVSPSPRPNPPWRPNGGCCGVILCVVLRIDGSAAGQKSAAGLEQLPYQVPVTHEKSAPVPLVFTPLN